MTVGATSRLRMWAYCLVLTALAFIQAPGRIVGDTKFDLVADPLGFLTRAATLWDPNAAFGQVQNQAYGYFWPMGPFFLAGDLAALPDWVVQRLWWSVLLCLAFVGTVRLARALDLGAAWARVLAGFAFALSAHVLTLLGPTSVEAWPSALAPWVLLPLVRATQGASLRRCAGLSALAVAMCGGVNAVAVSAVLPLGALWILTRTWTRRTWALFGWWVLFTVLATLWWVVPLLLLGRYSVPFLDYIENAPITTLPTSLADILGGTSDWVAYISREDWVAGNLLGTTPILLVNAAVIAALGIAGICRSDNQHRLFLFLGLLTGLVLVGFGYTGPLSGWWAEDRAALLDAALAPFRNLHKYDVVLRLCLVLGLAHFVTAFLEHAREAGDRLVRTMAVVAAVSSVAGVAAPAYAGQLAPAGGFERVPRYWYQAAAYLAEHGDRGVALEIPASPFGDYRWGSPHDDVLQPLASAPWAVRNIVPLAQPGNVRFLDAVTRAVELGRPNGELAEYLATNGVGHLVVRNDLDVRRTGAPDPVLLHQALDRSPGLTKVREFGPTVGTEAVSYVSAEQADRDGPGGGPGDIGGADAERRSEERVRVLANRGRQEEFAAVEIYAVDDAPGQVTAWAAPSLPVVAGEPASGLIFDGDVLDAPTVLAGDRNGDVDHETLVLTDGLRRRETAFTSVRENQSVTLPVDAPWSLESVVPNHRIYPDQERYETVATWVGVDSVTASSSQGLADAVPPIRRGQSAAAAFDGDLDTQWVSSGQDGAVGEWWRVELDEPQYVDEVTVVAGEAIGPRVIRYQIRTAGGPVSGPAPKPGESATYGVVPGPTGFVEVRAVEVKDETAGAQFSLAEVTIPGVEASRALATPDVFERAPDHILLGREGSRPACALVDATTWVCDDVWRTEGEESLSVDRLVPLDEGGAYGFDLYATVRADPSAVERITAELPVQVAGSTQLSEALRGSALAAIDGDPNTAWISGLTRKGDGLVPPELRLTWDEPVALSRIEIGLSDSLPAAMPQRLRLESGDQVRNVDLDDGAASFTELVTDDLTIGFQSWEEAYSFEGEQGIRLPVGVGELEFPGAGVLQVDATAPIDLGCGSGPTLSVNGARELTRIEGSLEQLMAGEALVAQPCGDGAAALRTGVNRVELTASEVTRPEQLHLTRAGVLPSSATPVGVQVDRWTATRRTVTVDAREEPTFLVVSENINPGWEARLDGRTLPVQRIDGWKQAWLLPPGDAARVVLQYEPGSLYRTGLLVGLATLLLVVVATLLPVRRRARSVPASSRAGAAVALIAVLAGGLLAGWLGAAGMLAAVALARVRRLPGWTGGVAAGLVAVAGVAHALARAGEFQAQSAVAQLLALLGLFVAAAAVANGPAFFRRSSGRSST